MAVAIAAAAVAAAVGDDPASPASPRSATARPPDAAGAAPSTAVRGRQPAQRERRAEREHRAKRRHLRLAAAAEWAEGRSGRVAFALAGPDGKVRGRDEHELFQSASVVKVLILAAELQRLADAGDRLEPSEAAELRRMITVSDNDAATAIFERVGPEGVDAIAHRAGMRDFRSSTTWGASVISAADMTAMFADLGRVFPERFRKFGLGLLGSIVPEQSWGIPTVARERGWSVRFKGGWRLDPDGQIVHQAAELSRDGDRRAIAVLSDRQPSMAYGIETVEGVSGRLLHGR
ncbi:MAG: serine hydrolase [Solirubrobacterales bacterium]